MEGARPGMPWHEKLLALALGLSLGIHIVFLSAQVVFYKFGPKTSSRQAKLIYHKEQVPAASEWTSKQQPVPAATQVRELARSMTATLPGPGAGRVSVGAKDRATALGAPNPERAVGSGARWGNAPGGAGAGDPGRDVWASAVDLTDLAAAAQGNPVLFSYFGAIREQIQRTADARAWLPEQENGSGVVYVGFVIGRTGALRSSSVVPERSTASPVLCRVALQIIQASNPFLPLPPSFTESSKAVVVPIEFAAR